MAMCRVVCAKAGGREGGGGGGVTECLSVYLFLSVQKFV